MSEDGDIVYRVIYTDGKVRLLSFEDDEEANWYLHNEGDHVLSFVRLDLSDLEG